MLLVIFVSIENIFYLFLYKVYTLKTLPKLFAEMSEARGSFDVVRTINMVREPCEANNVGEPKNDKQPNHANRNRFFPKCEPWFASWFFWFAWIRYLTYSPTLSIQYLYLVALKALSKLFDFEQYYKIIIIHPHKWEHTRLCLKF